MRVDGTAADFSGEPPCLVIMLRTGYWRVASKIKVFGLLLLTLAILQYFFGSSVYHVDYNIFQYYWAPTNPVTVPVINDVKDVDHRTVAILVAAPDDPLVSVVGVRNETASNETLTSTAVSTDVVELEPRMKSQPEGLEQCPLVPPVLGECLFSSSLSPSLSLA